MAKTTYDLTNLGLAAGTHSITVRAKAEGYADSEPSNAVEYVVEESVPTDLTGYTVTVPAGWTASAGYGQFNIEGTLTTVNNNRSYTVSSLYVGSTLGDVDMAPASNFIAWRTATSSRSAYGDTSSILVFDITGGDSADSSSLIQWFVDNNATFEKTA